MYCIPLFEIYLHFVNVLAYLHHLVRLVVVICMSILVQINDDSVGRSVEETLRLSSAFQWADSH